MVLPGHLAGGYLATAALLKLFHPALSGGQTVALYVIGTLAGEFPDIDIAWFYIDQVFRRSNDKQNHRDHVTHTPIFWLVLSLIIVDAGWLVGSAFTECLGWIVLAGTWSHFILDSIEYGIRWLWPFSPKRFCLREVTDPEIAAKKGTFTYYWIFLTRHYAKRISFYAEIAIVCIALYVAFR